MHSRQPPTKQVFWYLQEKEGLCHFFYSPHLLLVYNYLSEQQYPIVHDELSSNFQYHSPDHELGHFSGDIKHSFYEQPKLTFPHQQPQHNINPLKSLKDKFLGLFMKQKQSEYYPAGIGTSRSFQNIWKHLWRTDILRAVMKNDSKTRKPINNRTGSHSIISKIHKLFLIFYHINIVYSYR